MKNKIWITLSYAELENNLQIILTIGYSPIKMDELLIIELHKVIFTPIN
ncbi:hypothetical protein HPT25_12765 [Bacillus sp. BRMEA1]|nr:hypothetical protein [Neobacillus endophyticus]NRD78242.1 hypothetical protein [Neobacillus endophyticus]